MCKKIAPSYIRVRIYCFKSQIICCLINFDKPISYGYGIKLLFSFFDIYRYIRVFFAVPLFSFRKWNIIFYGASFGVDPRIKTETNAQQVGRWNKRAQRGGKNEKFRHGKHKIQWQTSITQGYYDICRERHRACMQIYSILKQSPLPSSFRPTSSVLLGAINSGMFADLFAALSTFSFANATRAETQRNYGE